MDPPWHPTNQIGKLPGDIALNIEGVTMPLVHLTVLYTLSLNPG